VSLNSASTRITNYLKGQRHRQIISFYADIRTLKFVGISTEKQLDMAKEMIHKFARNSTNTFPLVEGIRVLRRA
jgi:hypothetical protein